MNSPNNNLHAETNERVSSQSLDAPSKMNQPNRECSTLSSASQPPLAYKEEIVNDRGENTSRNLKEALEKYHISLLEKQVDMLNSYCEQLWIWNEKLNLTRHTTYDKFVSRDLIDSIRLASHLQKGEHVLDVGSGGGVPGLIVSILRPDVIVELCEATGKKAEALGEIAGALGLDVPVWYSKAEDLVKQRHFHTLTVRAVDKMRKLLQMFSNTWHCYNRILMIKGPRWPEERGEARHYNLFNALALRKIDEYSVQSGNESFNSVILQVCRKNKLEEIQQRAADLAEGKPYDGVVEELRVDNRQRIFESPSKSSNDRQQTRSRGNFSKTFSENKQQRDRQNNKDVKVPKGWTGKKKDFYQNAPADLDKRTSRNMHKPTRGSDASQSNHPSPRRPKR
ncbi:MAG: 16S rRNA (guanine(527)-N(7))-methyltransferase RsmG [Thermoguttaceae bacterium]|nr:16S rRNA (guanine(527)-N(7))-methyltransferase RsmG [Thermoguttaceae bacterium]